MKGRGKNGTNSLANKLIYAAKGSPNSWASRRRSRLSSSVSPHPITKQWKQAHVRPLFSCTAELHTGKHGQTSAVNQRMACAFFQCLPITIQEARGGEAGEKRAREAAEGGAGEAAGAWETAGRGEEKGKEAKAPNFEVDGGREERLMLVNQCFNFIYYNVLWKKFLEQSGIV